jgi:Formyl transferase
MLNANRLHGHAGIRDSDPVRNLKEWPRACRGLYTRTCAAWPPRARVKKSTDSPDGRFNRDPSLHADLLAGRRNSETVREPGCRSRHCDRLRPLAADPILEMPRWGCLNLHASLLPRWRGGAPIQRAIMAGDKNAGVDVMRTDAGLDTGPVAMRESTTISLDDTVGDLTSRLASVAAQLAVRALRTTKTGRLEFREQSPLGISYAHKIKKNEARY